MRHQSGGRSRKILRGRCDFTKPPPSFLASRPPVLFWLGQSADVSQCSRHSSSDGGLCLRLARRAPIERRRPMPPPRPTPEREHYHASHYWRSHFSPGPGLLPLLRGVTQTKCKAQRLTDPTVPQGTRNKALRNTRGPDTASIERRRSMPPPRPTQRRRATKLYASAPPDARKSCASTLKARSLL